MRVLQFQEHDLVWEILAIFKSFTLEGDWIIRQNMIEFNDSINFMLLFCLTFECSDYMHSQSPLHQCMENMIHEMSITFPTQNIQSQFIIMKSLSPIHQNQSTTRSQSTTQ